MARYKFCIVLYCLVCWIQYRTERQTAEPNGSKLKFIHGSDFAEYIMSRVELGRFDECSDIFYTIAHRKVYRSIELNNSSIATRTTRHI